MESKLIEPVLNLKLLYQERHKTVSISESGIVNVILIESYKFHMKVKV